MTFHGTHQGGVACSECGGVLKEVRCRCGELHGYSLSAPPADHVCAPTEGWATSVLAAAGWDPAEVHYWWRAPSGYLPDRARPIDHADVDPDRVRWLVREKAKRPGV